MAGLFDGIKSALGFNAGTAETTTAPANASANASGLAPNRPANMRALMNSTNTGTTMNANSKMAALAPPTGGAKRRAQNKRTRKGRSSRKGTKRGARK